MNVRRPFATDFMGSLGATLLGTAFGLLTSIATARAFGPEGKGLITLVLLVLAQVALLLSLGVDVALVHYGGRGRWPTKQLAGASIGLGIALGAAVVLVTLVVFAFFLREEIPDQLFPALVLLAVSGAVGLVASYVRSLLKASGRLIEASFLLLLKAVVGFGAVVAALLGGLGLSGVLLGQGLASLATDSVLLGLSARWGIIAGGPSVDWPIWKPLVSYGMKGHVGTLLQALNYRFDQFVVTFFLGTAGVGLYSTAVSVSEWLWLLPTVLSSNIMQRAATRTHEQANVLMGPVNRLTSAVLLAGMVVFALTGHWLIATLFGPAFAPAYLPFLLLLPGVWALGLWKNLINDLAGRGHPAAKSHTSGVAVVLTLALDLLLVPGWGIAGAALASSIAYTAALVAALSIYCRVTSYRPSEVLVPSIRDLGLAFGSMRQLAAARATELARRRNRA